MEQQIKDRYSDNILTEAKSLYGIESDQIFPINAFENYIYEYKCNSEFYILRIAHSIRRNENLILGEVDWINYLADRDVSVSRAIRSETGKFVERIEDGQGGYFLATAFVKARGQRPREAGWTPSRYEMYGQLLGKMHSFSTSYYPTDHSWKRPEWNDDIMEFVKRYLPASETAARRKYQLLCEHLNSLPKDSQSFGLIHQDAHEGNFFIEKNGGITLFDFDDCVYSWYINDIAVVLFYIAMNTDDPPAFTRDFMINFLKGYQKVKPLDPKWLKEIPYFLKVREIELYAVMHRDFDVNNIDNDWCKRFMRDRKFKIEQDVPYIDFDFDSLSKYLI